MDFFFFLSLVNQFKLRKLVSSFIKMNISTQEEFWILTRKKALLVLMRIRPPCMSKYYKEKENIGLILIKRNGSVAHHSRSVVQSATKHSSTSNSL